MYAIFHRTCKHTSTYVRTGENIIKVRTQREFPFIIQLNRFDRLGSVDKGERVIRSPFD